MITSYEKFPWSSNGGKLLWNGLRVNRSFCLVSSFLDVEHNFFYMNWSFWENNNRIQLCSFDNIIRIQIMECLKGTQLSWGWGGEGGWKRLCNVIKSTSQCEILKQRIKISAKEIVFFVNKKEYCLTWIKIKIGSERRRSAEVRMLLVYV